MHEGANASQGALAVMLRGVMMFALSQFVVLSVTCVLIPETLSRAVVVEVRNRGELQTALREAADGMTIRLHPGEYGAGYEIRDRSNLTLEAADPDRPPVFSGGSCAIHSSNCPNLTLRRLRVVGQSGNGINVDDPNEDDIEVAGIRLESLVVEDIGPRGNTDGLKCSGLNDLKIIDCRISGWGGQAIDLVGCHSVLVERCELTGRSGFSQDSGVQCKGGSRDVVIQDCQFHQAGQRPINAGGSTGLEWFRPKGAPYEAKDVTIRRNTIEGSLCACAFVGVDGAEFSENRVLYPEKWVFRILQESTAPRFVPCRNVVIRDNQIVFRRREVATEVNVGGSTDPGSFRFERNTWFAEDRPERSIPMLPVKEIDGAYGTDPR